MDYLTFKLLEADDPRGRLAVEKWVRTMSEEEKSRLRSVVQDPPAAWMSDPQMRLAVYRIRDVLRDLGELS